MKIYVKVKPGAKRDLVERISENEFRIEVRERAENGKANLKTLKLLSKELKISSLNMRIINPTGREKIVDISI